MQQRSPLYSPTFWFALTIVASAVVLMILTYNGKLTFIYINLNFTTIHHLFSWIGAGFIVVFTPLFYYLKRRLPRSYKSLIQIHVFGNLVAFVLISVHFAHHLREFEEIIPHPGTGAPLYTSVALLVITGGQNISCRAASPFFRQPSSALRLIQQH